MLTVALLWGCGQSAPVAYQGYAEGEFVLVAAPAAGQLEKRFVSRGDTVKPGAPLFSLEDENEKAARPTSIRKPANRTGSLLTRLGL